MSCARCGLPIEPPNGDDWHDNAVQCAWLLMEEVDSLRDALKLMTVRCPRDCTKDSYCGICESPRG